MKTTAELQEELTRLKKAVRAHSHNPELLRIAGPGSYEIERAAAREKLIAELFPRCEFWNPDPSLEARGCREQYQRTVRIQAVYKWQYGK